MKNKQFVITHVLIIKGPPKYVEETKPFHLKLFEVNNLPEHFTIKPAWGDAFLCYKDDGTVATACMRHFYMFHPKNKVKKWFQWPFKKWINPEMDIQEMMGKY